MSSNDYGPRDRTFYIYKYGELRHGHPQGKRPWTVQWHNAAAQHRDYPDLHSHHRAFDIDFARWSRQNGVGAELYVPSNVKDKLFDQARRAHDVGYKVDWPTKYDQYMREAGHTGITPKREEVTTGWNSDDDAKNEAIMDAGKSLDELRNDFKPYPTPVASDEVKPAEIASSYTEESYGNDDSSESTGDFEERLGNVEELALAFGTTVEPRIAQLEQQGAQFLGALGKLRTDLDKVPTFDASPLVERIESLEQAQKREVKYIVQRDEKVYTSDGVKHEKFDLLFRLATKLSPKKRNIWMAGPAGSGKSSAAEQLAEVLGLPFDFNGAVDSPYKISGYKSAAGIYQDTAFRRLYENGGVYLADELDGSAPGATLELNAALANGWASFPDKMVKRNEDFTFLGTANTWGFGGDTNYVGRNKMDAAFLDRFVKIKWNYDESLERAIAGDPSEWVDVVQAVRKACFDGGAVGFVISPRSSQIGCELLSAGMEPEEVVEAVFGGYREHPMWKTIGKAAEQFAKLPAYNAKPAPSKLNGLTVDMSQVKVWEPRSDTVAVR